MRLPGLFVAALCLGLVARSTQSSHGAELAGDGALRSVDCLAGTASVTGSRNVVTFGGICRSLTVHGDANSVTVTLVPGAAIDIQGNGNRIRYLQLSPAPLHLVGNDTELTAIALPSPPSDALSLSGDAQSLDLDCTGREVLIRGDRATYTLRGGCRSVQVHGDGDRVHAELRPDSRVTIDGVDTALAYTTLGSGMPVIDVHGEGSHAQIDLADSTVPPPVAPVARLPDPPDDPVPMPPPPAASPVLPVLPQAPPTVPHLAELMRQLHASVVAGGTLVSLAPDDLFSASDTLLPAGERPLQAVLQLAGLIHPSALRLALADPTAADLAGRRTQALAGWFAAHHQAVQPDAHPGVPPGIVGLLLAR